MTVKIDYDKCCWKDGKCTSKESNCGCGCSCGNSCGGCIEVCPTGAITKALIVKIDESKCNDCGTCIDVCPHNALSLS